MYCFKYYVKPIKVSWKKTSAFLILNIKGQEILHPWFSIGIIAVYCFEIPCFSVI